MRRLIWQCDLTQDGGAPASAACDGLTCLLKPHIFDVVGVDVSL